MISVGLDPAAVNTQSRPGSVGSRSCVKRSLASIASNDFSGVKGETDRRGYRSSTGPNRCRGNRPARAGRQRSPIRDGPAPASRAASRLQRRERSDSRFCASFAWFPAGQIRVVRVSLFYCTPTGQGIYVIVSGLSVRRGIGASSILLTRFLSPARVMC